MWRAPLTFIFGIESRIWGRAIRTLLICSAAKSVGTMRLAFSLCSVQTQGVVSHILLKHYTREGAARFPNSCWSVSQQLALQHGAFHLPGKEPPCRAPSPHPYFSVSYSCATFRNQETLIFETNPDFLGHCEGTWHCCPSAP